MIVCVDSRIFFDSFCVLKVERKRCQKPEQHLFCGELEKVDQIMFNFDKKNFSKVSGALCLVELERPGGNSRE